jgi:hypothetical protein
VPRLNYDGRLKVRGLAAVGRCHAEGGGDLCQVVVGGGGNVVVV